jgi:hypothetical protein
MIVAAIALVAARAFASISDVGSLRPDRTRCRKCSVLGTSETGKVYGASDIRPRQNHPGRPPAPNCNAGDRFKSP